MFQHFHFLGKLEVSLIHGQMVFPQLTVFVGVDSHFFDGSVRKFQLLEPCEFVSSLKGFWILVLSLLLGKWDIYLFIYVCIYLFIYLLIHLCVWLVIA